MPKDRLSKIGNFTYSQKSLYYSVSILLSILFIYHSLDFRLKNEFSNS